MKSDARSFLSADVRDFIGVRGPAGWALFLLYSLSAAIIALTATAGGQSVFLVIVALGLFFVAGLGLMFLPGDPLPGRSAMLVVAAVALSNALFLIQLSPAGESGSRSFMWTIPTTAIVLSLLSAMGAIPWAWLGFALMVVETVSWAVVNGSGAGAGIKLCVIAFAPLLMATFFSVSVRPTVRAIVELRRKSLSLAAAQRSTMARYAEREAQLTTLNTIASPLLVQIVDGVRITDDFRDDCHLVESTLRDRLRAPGLATDDILDAASAARSRGVRVVLLDDSGPAGTVPADSDVLNTIRAYVLHELVRTNVGSFTARVLPPGRLHAATVTVATTNDAWRSTVSHTGAIDILRASVDGHRGGR